MTRKRPKLSQKGSGCSPMRRSHSRRKILCGNWRLKHSKHWGGRRRRKTSPSIRAWSTMPGWTCLLATQADLALREISPNGASRMLKKPASIVLASLRGSTYRSVRLASSLAAALLDGLFEHPAYGSPTFHLSRFLGSRSGMADTVAEQIAALKDEDWAIREEA